MTRGEELEAAAAAKSERVFSSETYTTPGLRDIYPPGNLGRVTGIEALTGLLMIGWAASFTYLEMRRYW